MEDPVKSPALGIPIAIVIGSAIIGGALYLGLGASVPVAQSSPTPASASPAVAAAQTEEQTQSAEVAVSEDDPVQGTAEAPVTIIEFSDFQCQFCRIFQETVQPALVAQYVDTGKARLVFKHFPLTQIHERSQLAAQATVCAQAQDKFWPYADLLFTNQAALAAQDLVTYAATAKLDSAQFKTCLEDPKTQAKVFADVQAGITAGVTGTPTLIINGQLIDGSAPAADIAAIIDQALVEKQALDTPNPSALPSPL